MQIRAGHCPYPLSGFSVVFLCCKNDDHTLRATSGGLEFAIHLDTSQSLLMRSYLKAGNATEIQGIQKSGVKSVPKHCIGERPNFFDLCWAEMPQ